VLAAIASVQSGAAVATQLFPRVGAGGATLLRLGIAAILLAGVARPPLRSRPRRDLGTAVAFGLVLVAMNGAFYVALTRIPLGVAVTVEFVGPLAVAVLGSRRRLDVAWVLLAAAGVVLLSSAGSRLDPLGLALAAVAGGFWAGYILLSQRVGAIYPGASGLTIALVVGTVAVAPFGVVAGGRALLEPGVLARGLVVAVLSSALPYSLELAALRRMRTSVFGILMSLEPAVAALSGLLFLGQHLLLREWVAISAVVAASIGATATSRPTDVPVEPAATPTVVGAT
jgi:inner membrane transporter RhtA